jgi:PGF-pre-PGF domain-containing protein
MWEDGHMNTHLKSILLILITITLLTSIVSSVSAKKVSATNTSSSISSYKFNDINGNGQWDPNSTEYGIPNWTIELTILHGRKITVTTNDSGFFMFSNLSAGNYTLEEVQQTGWVQTFPIKIYGKTYYNITLSEGEDWNVDGFGNMRILQPQSTFNISGFKLNGTDNNGMGIENWNIMLFNDTNGTQIASIMTDVTGFYNFTGLTNGTYNVTEGMMTGWTNTSTSPMSQIVTINGADKTNVNFTNQVIVTPAPTITPTPTATETPTAAPAPASSHSSSGSSGSSGGSSGGGGVISTEPFNNIAKAESHEKDLLANKSVTYSFNPDEYSVYEVLVVGKQNEADVSMRMELLKGLSANVNTPASDSTNVYKYINIKIGSERISEAVLRFKVEAKWLSDNNLVGASMCRWVDGRWQVLVTTETSKDDTYVYYEAHPDGFSSFAIVGNKPISRISVSPTPIVSLPANQGPLTSPKPVKAASGFEVFFAVVALSVLYIVKRR